MSRNILVPSTAVVAALLACGVPRDLAERGSAAAACTGCHGDASRSGDALSLAAPATGAHLAHLQRNVACGSCHEVPGTIDHADGAIDVAFSGVALARGAQPSFSDGTCAGVYCHGATLGAGGGGSAAVSWSAGPLGCTGCHGAPPPSHAPSATSCDACHPGTVKADGTIDVASGLHANGHADGGAGQGQHAAGWGDPAQHGPAAKRDLASCQGCHGVSFSGGVSGVSCNDCHGGTAWMSNCTFCHGTRLGAYAPSDLAKAAPPRGAGGETATSDRAVGAHQRHLAGGSLGKAVACAECHAVPTDLSHLDGAAAVTFGPAASRGTSPSWNGATCASTYCHGATLSGGTKKSPSWTGAEAEVACGTCHGAPPPAPHTQSTACGGCHAGYGASSVDAALHMNGTVEAPAGATHPAGFANKEQHGYLANQGGLSSCKGCHGATLTGGAGPDCGSCHQAAGVASWATSCTFCHGNRATGLAAPPVDTQGRSVTTNVSVGLHAAHLGTALTSSLACTECHASRAGSNVVSDAAHVDGDGVAEVAFGTLARTGGAAPSYARASATSATCASTYCHGRFTGGVSSGAGATMSWTSTTQVSCSSCHGAPPSSGRHSKSEHRSCGDCHPGFTASSVNRTTHLDGARQVGNRVTSYDPTTRSCANTCHGAKTW